MRYPQHLPISYGIGRRVRSEHPAIFRAHVSRHAACQKVHFQDIFLLF